MISDDAGSTADATTQTASKTSAARRATGRRYPAEALREHQPRLIDVVPHKLTTLLMLFVLGAAIIAGVEAAYATHALDVGGVRLPAFDIAEEGSLNNWFTSLTLDLSAVVALVVYSLRRHRLDDYHGRYRIWLWTAACWLWLSIDEAACLHESFQAALIEFAHQSAREAQLVWLGAYALVIGGIGARLLFEVRACRSSTAALLLSAITFGASVLAHVGWLPAAALAHRLLIEEGCEMAGSLLLLFSMCLYVRHVVLDAQGLVAAKPAKEKKPESTPRRGLFGRKTKIDPAHDGVRPAGKRSDLDSVAARRADDDEDDEESGDEDDDDNEDSSSRPHDIHRLSKTERKALRRQQRRTRLG